MSYHCESIPQADFTPDFDSPGKTNQLKVFNMENDFIQYQQFTRPHDQDLAQEPQMQDNQEKQRSSSLSNNMGQDISTDFGNADFFSN